MSSDSSSHSSGNRSGDNEDDASSSASSTESMGEKILISLDLLDGNNVKDDTTEKEALRLPAGNESFAVPVDVTRKGLSAVVNHLLERTDDDDDTQDRSIDFDILVQLPNQPPRLLRESLESHLRRVGWTNREDAIPLSYFVKQPAPTRLNKPGPSSPDWIGAVAYHCATTESKQRDMLWMGCYDGSVQRMVLSGKTHKNKTQVFNVHRGPVKCLATTNARLVDTMDTYVATGSMDHTLMIQKTSFINDGDSTDASAVSGHFASCVDGHSAAVSSLDFANETLASSDWNGGVFLWKLSSAVASEEPVKRSKTTSSDRKTAHSRHTLSPMVSIQAHSTQVSGISWDNCAKKNSSSGTPDRLITGSWDHSLKLWDVERQDCLLTLNGSRVVSCLDTSFHSAGVVATGHPDCTVRLWDLRMDKKEAADGEAVSDNTFRPSHKAWVSAVKWCPDNPYQLSSTSHDGAVKLWDIRSPIPLFTIRVFDDTQQKGLALTYGIDNLYVGGTHESVRIVALGRRGGASSKRKSPKQ